jgi:hypothetical protein
MGLLISFLYLLLHIAIIVLVAFALLWLFKWFTGSDIEPNVYKWCQIVVGLLIIIAIVVWLSGLVGYGLRFSEAIGITNWATA